MADKKRTIMSQNIIVLFAAGFSFTMFVALAARRKFSQFPASTLLVSVPDSDVGRKLARALVQEKLAACVQILDGMTSVYMWQGAQEESTESLVLIKTRSSLVDRVTQRVLELHPYDVPEVVALPIVGGSTKYLSWLEGATLDR